MRSGLGGALLVAAVGACAAGCFAEDASSEGPTIYVDVVTTRTVGTLGDEDGYVVRLGGRMADVGANSFIGFRDVSSGDVEIELTDLVVGCHVVGPNPRTITVSDEIVEVPVEVRCTGRVAFESNRDGDYEIYAIDADGGALGTLTDNSFSDRGAAWSPDGARIAFFSNRDGNNEIYVMDADGGNPVNLTNDPAPDEYPAWSPDGTRIAFGTLRGSSYDIFVMDADGQNPLNRTNTVLGADRFPSWSPDGTKIAFVSDRDGNDEIYVMDADGGNQENLTNDVSDDGGPSWSPDGTRIAFHSDREADGMFLGLQVFVMDADGAFPHNVSLGTTQDFYPAWSADDAIAFGRLVAGEPTLFVLEAEGEMPFRIVGQGAYADHPTWRP